MDLSSSVPPPVPAGPTPGPAAKKPVAAWRWWIHLIVIGSYPLVIGLMGYFQTNGLTVETGPALGTGAGELLFVSAVTLLTFGVIFGLGWLASRASVDDLRLRWRGGWLPLPLGFVYAIGLRIFAGIAVMIVIGILVGIGQIKSDEVSGFVEQSKPDVEKVISVGSLGDNRVYYVLSLTLVSFVVAGLREELWRSATFAALEKLFPGTGKNWLGKGTAIVLTAVVFGLGHIPQGWLAVVLTGVLGLGLGTIIMFHRSIWTAVIAHGFFDATSLALLPMLPKLLEYLKHLQT